VVLFRFYGPSPMLLVIVLMSIVEARVCVFVIIFSCTFKCILLELLIPTVRSVTDSGNSK